MSAPYIDLLKQKQKENDKIKSPGLIPVARWGPHRIDRFLSTAYIATMALRDILIFLPDKRLRQVSEPVAEDRRGHPHWSRTCSRPCMTRRDRARRHSDRRAEAGGHHGPRQEGRPAGTRRSSSIRKSLWTSDEKRARGRLPLDPRILRGGRAPGRGEGELLRISTASRQEIDADGLLATCLQHEIDHLNGVLFIDHLSKLKRDGSSRSSPSRRSARRRR